MIKEIILPVTEDDNDPAAYADKPELQKEFKDRIAAAMNQMKEEKTPVRLLDAALIKPEPIVWIWQYWLAQSKFHVLAGPAGTGKTNLAIALAAEITRGGQWPDKSNAVQGEVLIWSGEDDPRDTIVPRLMACGADLSKVKFVGSVNSDDGVRCFDPARDVPLLEKSISSNVKLLIVDPVVNAVSADSHKNTEVRRALQPLVDFAARSQCAVLGITHFSKGTSGKDPLERVTGSIAFGALARVVMVAAKNTDKDGSEVRIFAKAKCNIGPDGGGFEYRIEQVEVQPDIHNSRVAWGKELQGSAADLLKSPGDDDIDNKSAMAEAIDWLKAELADSQVPAAEVFKSAEKVGICRSTLKRAKGKLRVLSHKRSDGSWVWELQQFKQGYQPE